MTPVETLRKARAWLAKNPKRWYQGEFGRRRNGDEWDPRGNSADPNPRCVCAAGAILLVDRDLARGYHSMFARDIPAMVAFAQAIGVANQKIFGRDDETSRAPDGDDLACSIGAWNDTNGRTHAEVLDAFSRAIAIAEAGESR